MEVDDEVKTIRKMSPLKPSTEIALGNLGQVIEPFVAAEEPAVCTHARSLFRRLLPSVTKNPHLLDTVPELVASLLDSLDRLTPKYDVQRKAISAVWAEVERTATK